MKRAHLIIMFGIVALIAGAVLWQAQRWTFQQHSAAKSPPRPAVLREAVIKSIPGTPGQPVVPPDERTRLSSERENAVIPPVLQPLLNVETDYSDRLRTALALTPHLDEQHLDALVAYLRQHGPTEDLAGMRERFLKNRVMDVLIEQTDKSAEATEALVALYHDREQDPAVRDYAIQHLGAFYTDAPREQRRQIAAVLWEATSETDSSMAGTALLALNRIVAGGEASPAVPEVGAERVAQVARDLAGNDHCAEASRITALQVCALLALIDAAPVALRVAQSTDSIPLKLSAIAALGQLGDAQALLWLEELAQDIDNPRLRPAAETALSRIRNRLAAEPSVAWRGSR